MFNLRIAIVLLLLWLAGLYNIERLHEPIKLASFVYVLTGVMAAAIICLQRLRKLTVVEITAASFVLYAVLKWALGYPFFGPHLPITVTECVVLGVTNALAWRVAHGIDDFLYGVRAVAAMDLGRRPLTFEDGEPAMYREVQRARRFHQRLALATVSFDRISDIPDIEHLLEKTRVQMARRYLESRFANALLENTDATDLVAYREGEFVLLFPETSTDSVRGLVGRVASRLGVRPHIGVAEFPDEECTLAGLIERAEARMRSLEFESVKKAELLPGGPQPVLVEGDGSGDLVDG